MDFIHIHAFPTFFNEGEYFQQTHKGLVIITHIKTTMLEKCLEPESFSTKAKSTQLFSNIWSWLNQASGAPLIGSRG